MTLLIIVIVVILIINTLGQQVILSRLSEIKTQLCDLLTNITYLIAPPESGVKPGMPIRAMDIDAKKLLDAMKGFETDDDLIDFLIKNSRPINPVKRDIPK